MTRPILFISALLTLALTGAGLAADKTTATTDKANAAELNAVICGPVTGGEEDFTIQQKINRAMGELPTVLYGAEYEGLAPDAKVFCAGMYGSIKQAQVVKKNIYRTKLVCDIVKIKARELTPRDIRFVGDQSHVWFCFKNGGGRLSDATCQKWLKKGRNLYRPAYLKRRKGVGYQMMTVRSASPDLSLTCGGQISKYEAAELRIEQVAPAIVDKAALAKLHARILDHMKQRVNRPFSKLEIDFAAQADLTGDGVPDTLFVAQSNDPRKLSPKVDLLSLIAVIDGKTDAVIELFYHHLPSDELRKDPELAQTQGRLLGLVDVDDNGRMDILIETRFADSFGLRVMTLDAGQPKILAMDVCTQ